MELLEITNEFIVNDINESIDFYTKYFGFEVVLTDGDPVYWAKIQKNNICIMFETYEEVCKEYANYPEMTESSNLIQFKCANEEAVMNIYNTLHTANIPFFSELKKTEYGSVEFVIFDPDKNKIIVSC